MFCLSRMIPENLSPDIADVVFSYLDPLSLARIEVAGGHLGGLAGDSSTWGNLAHFYFTPWSTHWLPRAGRAIKGDFRIRVLERKEHLASEAALVTRERSRVELMRRRFIVATATDIVHVRCLPPALGLSLVLLVIFLALYLSAVVDWSPFVVLSPVWAFVALAVAAAALGRYSIRGGFLAEEGAGATQDLLLLWPMQDSVKDSSFAAPGMAACVASMVCFLALVAHNAALSPSERLNWSAVFSPIWLSAALLCCAPCLRARHCQVSPTYLVGLLCLWLPGVVVILLALLRLEGTDISAWVSDFSKLHRSAPLRITNATHGRLWPCR